MFRWIGSGSGMKTGKLVGFGHTAQVGKDTAALGIGWTRVAFADGVRALALECNPVIGGNMPLSDLVNVQGWEFSKTNSEVRNFLQNLGAGARNVIGENVWLDMTMAHARSLMRAGENVAVTDVRYPNEFEKIKEHNGTLIKILRPDSPKMDHHSEKALASAEWDAVVNNDSTIAKLVDRVRAIVDEPS
jgi:hypothetical protein